MANPFSAMGAAFGGMGSAMGAPQQRQGLAPSFAQQRQPMQGMARRMGAMQGMAQRIGQQFGQKRPMQPGMQNMAQSFGQQYGRAFGQGTGIGPSPNPQMMNWLNNAPQMKDSLGQPQIIPDAQKQAWQSQMPQIGGPQRQTMDPNAPGYDPGVAGPIRGGLMNAETGAPMGGMQPQSQGPVEAPEDVPGVEEQRMRGGMGPSPNFMNKMY